MSDDSNKTVGYSIREWYWLKDKIEDELAEERGNTSNSAIARVIRAYKLDISPEEQRLLEKIAELNTIKEYKP